jgi:hypothetical protein
VVGVIKTLFNELFFQYYQKGEPLFKASGFLKERKLKKS